jgi:hypothetical protein
MTASPPPWPGAKDDPVADVADVADPNHAAPPPSGPAYPGPPPEVASAPAPAPRGGRTGRLIGIVLMILALLAVAVLMGDWLARNVEMDRLVSGIEESEAAMITAIDDVRAALDEDPLADRQAPETGDALVEIATDAGNAVAAAAADIGAVVIQPWHEDIVLARDDYLAHNQAWQDFLAAASQDPQEWFTDYEPINITWDAVGPTLRDGVPTPALWNLAERVELVLDDGEDTEEGPTLEAAG